MTVFSRRSHPGVPVVEVAVEAVYMTGLRKTEMRKPSLLTLKNSLVCRSVYLSSLYFFSCLVCFGKTNTNQVGVGGG